MMNLKQTTVITFLWVLVCGVLSGCAEEEVTENKLELSVYTDAVSQLNSSTWKSVSVDIEGVGTMPCELYAAGTAQTIALPKIPYETSFKVVLEMYGTEDCQNLMARGASVPTSVSKGDDKQQIFVHVAPAGTFTTPIVANSTQESFPIYPRVGASYTTLPDGKVVIIGGARLKEGVEDDYAEGTSRAWLSKDSYAEIMDTVEIYDPATGIFELVMPPGKGFVEEGDAQTLYYRRAFHAAVYLPIKNQIAIIGGLTQAIIGTEITASPSIELYDVTNRQFISADAVGPMNHGRVMPAATKLEYAGEELLLITGGTNFDSDPTQAQGSYEVITPVPTGHINDFRQMIGPRYGHKAVAVQNLQGARYVYLIGGQFDALNADGVFQPTDTQSLIDIFDVDNGYIVAPPQGRSAPAGLENSGRVGHSVHFLPATEQLPASVYVIGGYQDVQRTIPVARIEVLSAENGAPMTSAADNFVLSIPRGDHSSSVLPDNRRIMVSGGLVKDNAGVGMTLTGSTEIIGALYPSASGVLQEGQAPFIQSTVVAQAELTKPRFGFELLPLDNDLVLAVGGLEKIANEISEISAEVASAPAAAPTGVAAGTVATGTVAAAPVATDPAALGAVALFGHAELYVHHPSDLCQDTQSFCSDVIGLDVAPAAGAGGPLAPANPASPVVTGTPVAGTEGEATGGTEGEATGGTEGEATGGTEGEATGGTEGEATGGTEGEATGGTEGEAEGTEGGTEG